MNQEGGGGKRSTTLAVIGAWLYVGVPLAWGVFEVARKSLDLFR